MSSDSGVVFPEPPADGVVEWRGTPVGLSNTITRTKSRTAVHDKTIDKIPGKRDALVQAALRHVESHRGGEPYFQHDVIVHGVRVRAQTNSPHLYDFWVENWYSPEEWVRITGRPVPLEPQVEVYAFGGVAGEPEAAYYSRRTNTIVFFNTSYYGQLKSWVLGAVGRILAEEYGIHSIHGAVVQKAGRGVLYIAPTGTGKSTSSYGLMEYPDTRFHSDDWVYVRYVMTKRDGQRFAPTRVEDREEGEVRGYRVFPWLETHRHKGDALVHGLGLSHEEIICRVSQLDFTQPLEAYAYISEKVFYLRSNLVENFPSSAYELLHSKFENCPDVTPLFMSRNGEIIGDIVAGLQDSRVPQFREFFSQLPREELATLVGRLFAFDNARAMLDISQVLEPKRAFLNPLEPSRLAAVFILRRNFQDDVVLEHLGEEGFIQRLMIGETPLKTYETAYNAYRAVDDEEERALIEAVRQEASASSGRFYDLYRARQDIPQTLLEEFELFRLMYRTACCYDLNTILQKDQAIKDKQQAVRTTMELLARVIDRLPQGVVLRVENYRSFLSG